MTKDIHDRLVDVRVSDSHDMQSVAGSKRSSYERYFGVKRW